MRLDATRDYKDEDGRRRRETCTIDVVAHDRTAEIASAYLKKGRAILVSGRLEYRKGREHYIRANTIKFLSGSKAGAEAGQASMPAGKPSSVEG
jgi:single-stranded DNA-binding protein